MNETYVYEQVEVKKTGRTAQNPLRSGRVDILHEITPVDAMVGSWKKWVREDVLYTVDQDNTDTLQ